MVLRAVHGISDCQCHQKNHQKMLLPPAFCCLTLPAKKAKSPDFSGLPGRFLPSVASACLTQIHSHSIINKTESALFLLCFLVIRFANTIVSTITGKCCNLPAVASTAIIKQATGIHFTGHAPRRPGINTRSPSTPSTVRWALQCFE